MVTLRRAQNMTDPEARRQELEKAEQTFLAVQGIAGDDDHWRLQVGQVYYWLGKHEEGKREFEQLLANNNRSFPILMAVGQILRELGAYGEAREILEEAYEKASDDPSRYAAAHLRATSHTDLLDEITWLERCNPSTPGVRAQLCGVRGDQAANEGNEDLAADHYREAIEIYDGMNETSSTLNNSALVYLALHALTGDESALANGIERIEKAISLEPDNAILLANSAYALIRAAIRELAGPALEDYRIESSEDMDVLSYLVTDQQELEELRERARQHPGLQKARSYLDKTMLLAPKGLGAYTSSAMMDLFFRDEEALRRLAQRIDATTVDMTDLAERYLAYYRFEDPPQDREQRESSIERTEQVVQQFRQKTRGPAYATAVGDLVEELLKIDDVSQIDSDRLVRLAEEAHQAAPSSGSYSTLTTALLYRASEALGKAFPEYAEAAETARRSLSPYVTVVLVLSRDDKLGEVARNHPDVQRVVELMIEKTERFPLSRGPFAWALFRTMAPARAEAARQHIVDNEIDRLGRSVGLKIIPFNAAGACLEYWARLADGSTDTARAPLETALELGAPVPTYLLNWDAE
jgi:tetratricopeptide (TPR) repeat protein